MWRKKNPQRRLRQLDFSVARAAERRRSSYRLLCAVGFYDNIFKPY